MPAGKSPLASIVDGLVGVFSQMGGQHFEQRETKTIPAGDYAHLELTNGNGNVAVEGDEDIEFGTTCFYGARGQIRPRVGDRVTVILNEAGVLAVILLVDRQQKRESPKLEEA